MPESAARRYAIQDDHGFGWRVVDLTNQRYVDSQPTRARAAASADFKEKLAAGAFDHIGRPTETKGAATPAKGHGATEPRGEAHGRSDGE